MMGGGGVGGGGVGGGGGGDEERLRRVPHFPHFSLTSLEEKLTRYPGPAHHTLDRTLDSTLLRPDLLLVDERDVVATHPAHDAGEDDLGLAHGHDEARAEPLQRSPQVLHALDEEPRAELAALASTAVPSVDAKAARVKDVHREDLLGPAVRRGYR